MSQTPTHAANAVRHDCPRVLAAALDGPWAMDEGALNLMIEIVLRENDGPEAVHARPGRPVDGAQRLTIRDDGVAILPIVGPLFRRANLFTEISGATSVEHLATDLQIALDTRAVERIVLEVDSPGGQAAGINELAKAIAAAGEIKPVVAYVGSIAASGGYWLAAAASQIIIDESAELGSIGVVMGIVDSRARDAARGIRTIEIVSSGAPNKRPSIDTEDGLAEILRRVDALEDVFVGAVAAFRGTTPEAVRENFGAGGVLMGADAIAAGMADGLGTLEQVIAGTAGTAEAPAIMPALGATHAQIGGTLMSDPKTETAVADEPKAETIDPAAAPAAPPPAPAAVEDDRPTAATTAALFPDVATALRAEGAQAERARVLGIEAFAEPGAEALVAQYKADGVTTPDQAAGGILEHLRGRRAAQLGALVADEEALAAPPASPSAAGTGTDGAANAAPGVYDEAAERAKFTASAELQAEFREEGRFLAFRKAEASGRVKRLVRPVAA